VSFFLRNVVYPRLSEQQLIFDALPQTKKDLIEHFVVYKGYDEQYIRSLIWRMRNKALIYTGAEHLIKKV